MYKLTSYEDGIMFKPDIASCRYAEQIKYQKKKFLRF